MCLKLKRNNRLNMIKSLYFLLNLSLHLYFLLWLVELYSLQVWTFLLLCTHSTNPPSLNLYDMLVDHSSYSISTITSLKFKSSFMAVKVFLFLGYIVLVTLFQEHWSHCTVAIYLKVWLPCWTVTFQRQSHHLCACLSVSRS